MTTGSISAASNGNLLPNLLVLPASAPQVPGSPRTGLRAWGGGPGSPRTGLGSRGGGLDSETWDSTMLWERIHRSETWQTLEEAALYVWGVERGGGARPTHGEGRSSPALKADQVQVSLMGQRLQDRMKNSMLKSVAIDPLTPSGPT